MEANHVLTDIRNAGLVAILRKTPPDAAVPLAKALVNGGVRAIEITMESNGAIETIRELRRLLNDEMLVGAGTVTSRSRLQEAIDAGADFLVSPHLDLELVQEAQAQGRPFIPGVLTPTEVALAVNAGLSLLKLFPSGSFGPSYLKDLLGPFDQVPFLCTGGITAQTAVDYILAGAVGVGMGSALIPRQLFQSKDWEGISAQVAETVRKIRRVKDSSLVSS